MELRDIYKEIKKIDNELEFQLTKKQINFGRTQPQSVKLKEICVQSSFKDYDPLLSYLIKDEECDYKIDNLLENKRKLESLLTKEFQRIREYDDTTKLVVFYHDDCGLPFNKIDRILNYAEDTCKKKYERARKKNIEFVPVCPPKKWYYY